MIENLKQKNKNQISQTNEAAELAQKQVEHIIDQLTREN